MDTPVNLTPSPAQSGTLMLSKAPGRDIEERSSLDMVIDFGSLSKFHRTLLPFI